MIPENSTYDSGAKLVKQPTPHSRRSNTAPRRCGTSRIAQKPVRSKRDILVRDLKAHRALLLYSLRQVLVPYFGCCLHARLAFLLGMILCCFSMKPSLMLRQPQPHPRQHLSINLSLILRQHLSINLSLIPPQHLSINSASFRPNTSALTSASSNTTSSIPIAFEKRSARRAHWRRCRASSTARRVLGRGGGAVRARGSG